MLDKPLNAILPKTLIDTVYGDFHITVQGITDEEAGLIKKRPDVKAAARYGVLNFNGDKGYTISDKKSIIVGADEEFVTQLQMGVINEGNFPKNDNEAMITKNAGENLGLQIGDTVIIKRPGEPELSYQISGFCNNTSKIMSEDAYGVFLTTSAFREIGDTGDSTVLADHNMVLFVQFTKTYNIQNTINRLKEDCNLSEEQISENTKLLGLLGQSSNSFMMQVYTSAFVLCFSLLSLQYIDPSSGFKRCLLSKISAHNNFSNFLWQAVSKTACFFALQICKLKFILK